MSTFEKRPIVSFYDLDLLLNTIYDTFNTNGKINTYQIQRIASGGVGSAVWSALRNTESKDGFEDRLARHCRAMQGIANTFNFKLDAEWNLNKERTNWFENKVPAVKSTMMNLLIRATRNYYIPDEDSEIDKVAHSNVRDVMDELEFMGVTSLDEKFREIAHKELIKQFMLENKDELLDEYTSEYISTNGVDEADVPKASFKILKDFAFDLVEMPDAVPSYERLEVDAEKVTVKHMAIAQTAWDKVEPIASRIYVDVDINALHGTDGLTGEERFTLVEAILRSFDWSQQNSNDTLEQLAYEPDAKGGEGMAESNLAGAMAIIPICNELIERAEEVFKSNTSEEISREYEEGVSDNLAEDKAHDYEVSENIPHGSMG